MAMLALGLGFILPISSFQDSATEIRARLAEFTSLSEGLEAGQLARSPSIRELLIDHDASVPGLKTVLATAEQWQIRLAAAYVLREKGFGSFLAATTEDKHPIVRNYARAVVQHKPRPPGDDSAPIEYYTIDDSYRKRIYTLIESPPTLTESDRREWVKRVVAHFGSSAPQASALTPRSPSDPQVVALEVAKKHIPLVSEHVAVQWQLTEDNAGKTRLLRLINELAVRDSKALGLQYSRLRTMLQSAMTSDILALRALALQTGLDIAPDEQKQDLVLRAMTDSEDGVRQMAVVRGLALINELESRGETSKADALLAQLKGVASKVGDKRFNDFVEEAVESHSKIMKNRRDQLSTGTVILDREGNPRTVRFLRVGSVLEDVPEDVYQAAMAKYGKPYLSREAYTALVKAVMGARDGTRVKRETRQDETDEKSAVASSSTSTEPPDSPAAAETVRTPRKDIERGGDSGRVGVILGILGGLVLILVLTAIYSRRRRMAG